jgi:phosphoribosylformylglycinamidine synthase
LALGLGLSPLAIDPRAMAAYALDEAIRNALVSGLNPEHAALVDNFCWPDPLEGANNKNPIDAHRKLGDLVLTCQTIHDAAVALNLPFVSGKDSMKNDYRSGGLQISVLPTLLITVMGKIEDVRVIPASFVQPYGGDVYWISAQHGQVNPNGLYEWDAHRLKDFAKLFHTCMQKNFFLAAHDISEGGFLSATAEMFFGTGLSLDFDFGLAAASLATQAAGYLLFSERPSSFVVQAAAGVDLAEIFSKHGFYVHRLGKPITPSEDLPARFYSIDQKFYIEIEKLEGAYFGNQKSV